MEYSKTFTAKEERIILENLKLRFSQKFGQYTLSQLNYAFLTARFTDEIMMEVQTKILGQKNIQEYKMEFSMSKNWWQHLRQTILPKWWLKRFPVKEKTIVKTKTFNHMALLPKWSKNIGQEVVMYSEEIYNNEK